MVAVLKGQKCLVADAHCGMNLPQYVDHTKPKIEFEIWKIFRVTSLPSVQCRRELRVARAWHSGSLLGGLDRCLSVIKWRCTSRDDSTSTLMELRIAAHAGEGRGGKGYRRHLDGVHVGEVADDRVPGRLIVLIVSNHSTVIQIQQRPKNVHGVTKLRNERIGSASGSPIEPRSQMLLAAKKNTAEE